VLYRLSTLIAAIGLAQQSAAAEIDTAYLRGAQGHEASAPVSGSAQPLDRIASSPSYLPPPILLPPMAGAAALVFKAPIAPTPPIPVAPPPWIWTGFYAGGHIGSSAATAKVAGPFGASIYGDNIVLPGFLAGGRIGFNWQLPDLPLVLGVEADVNWLDSQGTNTCLAYSGLFVSANCRARPDMLGDLTGRVGWAYGNAGHSLVYAKGGAALVRDQIDMATNATPDFGLAPLTTSSSFTKVGWIVGAGVEHALTPAWSVKFEYDYAGFGGVSVATPPGLIQPVPGVNGYNFTSAGSAPVTQNFQEASLGLNYKFGMDPTAQWGAPIVPVKPIATDLTSGWELEGGARYWYAPGRFQKDLGSTTEPTQADILNSRLTYKATADAGELFGRVEAPFNVFLKGFAGLGSQRGGQLNDEDWVLFSGTVAYSNTVSGPVSGDIGYGTIDLGYDVFRAPGYKLGAFVGYNYYQDSKRAFGCTQIANAFSDCVPAIPNSILAITENDAWQSLRVGLNGQVMVTDRLKLEADAAYLPYSRFDGTDDHVLRNLISPEWGIGRGVQLEGIFSYLVTEQLSLGIGARYWAMWTTQDASTAFGGTPCPCQTQPARAERYGVFLQASYKLGGPLYQ